MSADPESAGGETAGHGDAGGRREVSGGAGRDRAPGAGERGRAGDPVATGPGGGSPRRRWGLGRKLLLQLALLPVLLGAAELAYRALLAARGRPYDAAAARVELAEIVGSMNSPFPEPEEREAADAAAGDADTPDLDALKSVQMLHPYLGFDMAEFAEIEAREVDYFATPAAAAAYDVLIVGGSVSARFGKYGTPRLAELLRADPRLAGREVRFLQHGRGAFKQPQQAVLVGFLLTLGYRPDAVLNLDGFNEVALANDNAQRGTHPAYPQVVSWGRHALAGRFDWDAIELLHEIRDLQTSTQALGGRALELGLTRSALVGRPLLKRLHAMQQRSVDLNEAFQVQLASGADARLLHGPPFETDQAAVLRTAVRNWMESSRVLQAMCRGRGIHYLHVLQPTLHDAGSKPLSFREKRHGKTVPSWTEGARLGYPLLRAGGERLRQLGVNFLDASLVFADVEQRLYFDACHFRPPGHAILAEAIAPALLESLPGADDADDAPAGAATDGGR